MRHLICGLLPGLLPACLPLIHADDVARIGADNCTITPTGAAFLQPSIRPGVLPAILSALMAARATTRAALKSVQQQLQQARQAQQQQQREGGSRAAGDAVASSGRHAGEGVAQLVARAAVLDGRQKALKVTANALYVSTVLLFYCTVTFAITVLGGLRVLLLVALAAALAMLLWLDATTAGQMAAAGALQSP